MATLLCVQTDCGEEPAAQAEENLAKAPQAWLLFD